MASASELVALVERCGGITSAEAARIVGVSAGNIASRLSKLAYYGRIGRRREGHKFIWCAKEESLNGNSED